MLSDGHTLYVGGLHGNITAQYPASDAIGAEGAISDLASITSGKYAGMFAALRSGPPSSLTIFTFDGKAQEKEPQGPANQRPLPLQATAVW